MRSEASQLKADRETPERLLRVQRSWARGWQKGAVNVLFDNPQRTCFFVATLLAMVLVVVDSAWWSRRGQQPEVVEWRAYRAVCGRRQVFRRRSRLPEPRWAYGADFLAGTGWVGLLSALGGEVGLAVAGGSAELLGRGLAIGAGVAFALTGTRIQLRATFPSLPGRSEQDDRFSLILFVGFLVLAGLGLWLMNGGAVDSAVRVAALVVVIVPALGPLRALGLARSAIEPCSPAQILACRAPWEVRLRVAALGASATLPFGGLAVPLWRTLRRDLRSAAPAVEGNQLAIRSEGSSMDGA